MQLIMFHKGISNEANHRHALCPYAHRCRASFAMTANTHGAGTLDKQTGGKKDAEVCQDSETSSLAGRCIVNLTTIERGLQSVKGSLIEGGARLCSACLCGYKATPEQQALCTLKPVVLNVQLHTCNTQLGSSDTCLFMFML